jgi:RNA polymerase sigma factor (sigma-70 family)
MKDYRLTIKVRNNRILKAIESVGGTPGQKWCAAKGLVYWRLNELINMTIGPLTEDYELHPEAAKLCDVLGKLPEDLWSNDQLYPLQKNFSDMEMNLAQVVALLPKEYQSYDLDLSEFERSQTKDLVSRVVSTLMPREQEVIWMRFKEELSLEECGMRLGISRERVRQIESRSIRKLRHPSRAGMIVDLTNLKENEPEYYMRIKDEYFKWPGKGAGPDNADQPE